MIINGYDIKPGADLSRADLRNADLAGADLRNADLAGADLRNANLSRANLSDADLSRANLSRANLSDADLSRANLSRANLSRANLSRANLSRANLSRANLSGATGIFDLGMPHGYQVYMVIANDGIHIKAGCRWMTWEEANKYWRGEGDKKPRSTALLVYARAVADSLGWRL